MAQLVSDDEQNLRHGGTRNRIVVNDDAFGSANASDISVQSGCLRAGIHHEHAIGGNLSSAVMNDFLHLQKQDGLHGLERREFVKQRIDDDRLEKEKRQ